MSRMYLILNRNNGNIAHLPLSGLVVTVNLVTEKVTNALMQLKDGEYCHIGHYTIVGSAGGITIDELAARTKPGCTHACEHCRSTKPLVSTGDGGHACANGCPD